MEEKRYIPNYTIRDAKIMWRNLSGAEGLYNKDHARTFSIFLTQTDAEVLRDQGWNVTTVKPRPDADPNQPIQEQIKITASYKFKPPVIFVVTSNGKTALTEETVGMLDWAEIKRVDLTFNPSFWTHSGKSGVKAYLKTMYVTLVEDELAAEYADPDGGGSMEAIGQTPEMEGYQATDNGEDIPF